MGRRADNGGKGVRLSRKYGERRTTEEKGSGLVGNREKGGQQRERGRV